MHKICHLPLASTYILIVRFKLSHSIWKSTKKSQKLEFQGFQNSHFIDFWRENSKFASLAHVVCKPSFMVQSRQTLWIEQFFDEKKVTTNGFWELNIIIVTIDEGEWRMSRWGIGTQRRKSVEKNSIFSRDNPQLLVTFRRTLFEVIMSNPAKISIFLRFRKNRIYRMGKKQLAFFSNRCMSFEKRYSWEK